MPVIIDTPKNRMPRINSIWAFLSVDKDGDEGVCAMPWPGTNMPMPMIAADPIRLKELIPYAEELARLTDMKIMLVEFTERVDVREITGKPLD